MDGTRTDHIEKDNPEPKREISTCSSLLEAHSFKSSDVNTYATYTAVTIETRKGKRDKFPGMRVGDQIGKNGSHYFKRRRKMNTEEGGRMKLQ